MAQDIRELFKNDKGIPRNTLSEGHFQRFEKRLDTHFGRAEKKSNNYLWLKVAAVVIVLLTAGGLLLNQNLTPTPAKDPSTGVAAVPTEKPELQLSDLSPQFKKVEDYYTASINMELAQLQVNDINKDLVDSFMAQMEELNTEYKKLNNDLVEVGINDQTVTALIDNLKLRLDLLLKLKQKLKDIKQEGNRSSEPNRI